MTAATTKARGEPRQALSAGRRFDWKLAGYLISSLSVLLLGATAWPGLEHEGWRPVALIGGMLTSILGMACREYSHREEKAAIAYAQQRASEQSGRES